MATENSRYSLTVPPGMNVDIVVRGGVDKGTQLDGCSQGPELDSLWEMSSESRGE